jgi:DNA-directed RNA polymerase subunit RPC12/RpoP
METTNEKKCPKCGSEDVFDTGDRMGDVHDYTPGKPIPEPNHPIYKCRKCGELFVLGKQ